MVMRDAVAFSGPLWSKKPEETEVIWLPHEKPWADAMCLATKWEGCASYLMSEQDIPCSHAPTLLLPQFSGSCFFLFKLQTVFVLLFFNSSLSMCSRSSSPLEAGESQKFYLMKYPFEKSCFHWNQWQNSHWFHVGWGFFQSRQTMWLSLFDLLIESWGSIKTVVLPKFSYVENIARTSFYEVCYIVFLDLGHVSKDEFLCVSSRGKH